MVADTRRLKEMVIEPAPDEFSFSPLKQKVGNHVFLHLGFNCAVRRKWFCERIWAQGILAHRQLFGIDCSIGFAEQ